MQTTNRRRLLLRFSVSTLLFLTACVCGYLGGYQSGFEKGDAAYNYGATYVKSYGVYDLVRPIPNFETNNSRSRADFTELLAILRDAGKGEPGDECSIRPFEINLSVVVHGNGKVHRRVESILDELRSHDELAASAR